MLARINKLIGDVRRDPFTGISKVPGTGPLSGAYAGRRSLLSVNDRESPRFTVRSGGQRARYALLVLAGVLVDNTLHQKQGVERSNDITGMLLAICIPVVLLPLPFFFEHLNVRGTGRWAFSRTGEGPS